MLTGKKNKLWKIFCYATDVSLKMLHFLLSVMRKLLYAVTINNNNNNNNNNNKYGIEEN